MRHADRAAMIELICEVAPKTRAEPGCLAFHFGWDAEALDRLHLFECWADRTAIEAHFTTPHFHAFMDRYATFAKQNVRRERFEAAAAEPFQPPR